MAHYSSLGGGWAWPPALRGPLRRPAGYCRGGGQIGRFATNSAVAVMRKSRAICPGFLAYVFEKAVSHDFSGRRSDRGISIACLGDAKSPETVAKCVGRATIYEEHHLCVSDRVRMSSKTGLLPMKSPSERLRSAGNGALGSCGRVPACRQMRIRSRSCSFLRVPSTADGLRPSKSAKPVFARSLTVVAAEYRYAKSASVPNP